MNKVVSSAEEAIRDVGDGALIMFGGFGLCGNPENLIRALVKKGAKNLTTMSNNAGIDGQGIGMLLAAGQIRRHIGTYVGENKLLESMVLSGQVQLDLVPQGTFSERIRAGGACMSWSAGSKLTSRSCGLGRATAWGIWFTGRRRGISIP
jgi:3-oxoacid CoA-transferase subunit A